MAVLTNTDILTWFQSARGVSLSSPQVSFLSYIQPLVEQAIWQVLGYTLEQSTYTEFLPASGAERPPLEFGIDVGWDRIGGVVMPRSRMDPSYGSIQLTRLPVRSITSIYENLAAWTTGLTDGDWPSTSLQPPTAYRLDMSEPGLCKNGRLIRTVGSWPTSPRTVKLTYVAGWTTAEIAANVGNFGPIKMAALDSLGWWWGKAMRASASVRSNMMLGTQVSIRDFSVTLGVPQGTGMSPGTWAAAMLSPEAMHILMMYVNMAKYLGG